MSCSPRWEDLGLEPKILFEATGKTEVKSEKVLLCPYCDGDAVKVTKKNLHDPL